MMRAAYWTFWAATIVFVLGALQARTGGFLGWIRAFPSAVGGLPPHPAWEIMSLFSVLGLLGLSIASYRRGHPHWGSTIIAVLFYLFYQAIPVG